MLKKPLVLGLSIAPFAVGLITLTLILNTTSQKNYPPYRLHWLLAHAIEQHHRDKAHVLLGHSQATGFKFRHAPVDGFEYWFNSQDIFETAHLLKNIRDVFPNIETVYVPLTTRDLYVDNGSSGANTSLIRIAHYANQRILRTIGATDWSLVGWDIQNAFQGWFMPSIRRDRWYRPVERLRHRLGLINREPREFPKERLDERGFRKPLTQKNEPEKFAKLLTRQSRFTVNQIKNAQYFDYRGLDRAKATIDDMIETARELNICLVFFATPKTVEYETLVRKAIPNTVGSFDLYLNELEQPEKGYQIIDLRKMPNLDTYTHFYDSFHLNEAGARLMTTQLFEQLSLEPCGS